MIMELQKSKKKKKTWDSLRDGWKWRQGSSSWGVATSPTLIQPGVEVVPPLCIIHCGEGGGDQPPWTVVVGKDWGGGWRSEAHDDDGDADDHNDATDDAI